MNRLPDPPVDDCDLASRVIVETIRWLADGVPLGCLAALVSEDAEEALTVVERHGLGPALYSALRATAPDVAAKWPRLRNAYFGGVAQSVLATEQIRQCAQVLNRYGIRVIALKGNDYILRLYADAARRRISDIDLLLQEQDIERAMEALAEIGYRKETIACSPEAEWLHTRYLSDLWLVRPKSLPLDIHTSVLGGSGNREQARTQLWAEALPYSVDAAQVELLPPELAFVVQALHYSKHWRRATPYCKDLADLVLLSRAIARAGDFERMWETARRWQVEDDVRTVVAVVNRYFDARVPLSGTPPDVWTLHQIVYPEHDTRRSGRVFESLKVRFGLMRHLPSPMARVRYVLGFFVPQPAYLRWRYKRLLRPLPLLYGRYWWDAARLLGKAVWHTVLPRR